MNVNDPSTSNSAAGEPYASLMASSITIQRQFRNALPSIYSYSQTAHYQDRADSGIAGEAYANISGTAAEYPTCPTTLCAPGKRWVMWDVPFYMTDILTFRGARSLWTPEVRGGYVLVIGAKRAGIGFSNPNILRGEKWTTNSAKVGGSYGTVGTGMKIKLADRFIFAVDYDYTFGRKYSKHAVSGTYGISF